MGEGVVHRGGGKGCLIGVRAGLVHRGGRRGGS